MFDPIFKHWHRLTEQAQDRAIAVMLDILLDEIERVHHESQN